MGADRVLNNPREPYTIKLLESVPRPEAGWLSMRETLSADQSAL